MRHSRSIEDPLEEERTSVERHRVQGYQGKNNRNLTVLVDHVSNGILIVHVCVCVCCVCVYIYMYIYIYIIYIYIYIYYIYIYIYVELW